VVRICDLSKNSTTLIVRCHRLVIVDFRFGIRLVQITTLQSFSGTTVLLPGASSLASGALEIAVAYWIAHIGPVTGASRAHAARR
jgi:hypothetical protein